MSLQTRFVLLYGVGGVFFFFIVALVIFNQMESTMTTHLQAQFHNDASGRAHALDDGLDRAASQFLFSAEMPSFRGMRYHELTLNEAALRNEVRGLELYFLEYQGKQQGLLKIRYMDLKGRELVRIENGRIVPHKRDLSQDPGFGKARLLPEGQVQVTLSRDADELREMIWWVPVYAGPEVPYGVLAFHTAFDVLRRQVQAVAIEAGENVCLTGERGELLVASSPGFCRAPDSGHWRVTSSLGLPGLPWSLWIYQDPSIYLAEVQQLRWLAFGVILPFVSVLGLFMVATTSRRITDNVKSLAAAAKTMGEGGKVENLDVHREDELGDLAQAVRRASDLIQEKTHALERSNRELESYSYSIAHDLRTPVRAITSFSQLLQMDASERLDDEERDMLNRVVAGGKRMSGMIDEILELSRISRSELERVPVDMSAIASEIMGRLRSSDSERVVDVRIAAGLRAEADPRLVRVLLENLLGNAWKYSAKVAETEIEFGLQRVEGMPMFFVKDNGAGFDMSYADNLYKPFHRLHRGDEFEGSGVGLATVYRIVQRHGGRIRAEAAVNQGASFFFSLG